MPDSCLLVVVLPYRVCAAGSPSVRRYHTHATHVRAVAVGVAVPRSRAGDNGPIIYGALVKATSSASEVVSVLAASCVPYPYGWDYFGKVITVCMHACTINTIMTVQLYLHSHSIPISLVCLFIRYIDNCTGIIVVLYIPRDRTATRYVQSGMVC